MTAQTSDRPVDPFDQWIDETWGKASIWGKISMVLGALLVSSLILSAFASYTQKRWDREAAIAAARAELQQNIGQEVDVLGSPHPARFRVEEVPQWGGPIRGTLVALLPEGTHDIQILPSLVVSDTESSGFGLTDFELALSECSFSVNYSVGEVQRARVWNGCPTLKEGIEISVREIEARVGEP